MMHRNKFFSETNIYWVLFVVMFVYAILRAILVVPMLDEISTFFSYIRTGQYFNTIQRIDANNHILTSFFGHQFYRIFGDHFFFYRVSSLMAFPLYFFTIKWMVQRTIANPFRMVVFLSIVFVPWIFEYFSFARGYALALSFFFAAIMMAMKWRDSNQWRHLILLFVFIWATVASNLSYMLPSFILVGYVVVLFFSRGSVTFKKTGVLSLTIVGWVLAMLPIISYSLKLKAAGALWWGNQDGLWASTGTSVSNLVLFTDESWVFYLLSTVLAACGGILIVRAFQKGFLTCVREDASLLFILLITVLAGIEIMRIVLDINYPMDRVAMYLVPLFILSYSMLVYRVAWLKYTLWALLFFPVSFVYKANVSTSIFSPEDRIPVDFANYIKANVSDSDALSAEHVSHVSYAFSCRNDAKVHMAYTKELNESDYADFHISWLDGAARKNYTLLRRHSSSKTGFMKRNEQVQRTLVVDTIIQGKKGSDLYFNTLQRSIDTALMNESLQVRLTAEMTFDEITNAFGFAHTIRDAENNVLDAYGPAFSYYFSDRKDINFVFVDKVFELKPEADHFHFFWVNNDQIGVDVKYIRVEIFKITVPED